MFRSRSRPRQSSGAVSESSASTSPERVADDDTDFFLHDNDSQSSVGAATFRDLRVDSRDDSHMPPISRLPSELLIAIFSKLTSTADMARCMRVSQRWAVNCVGILWLRPSCSTLENLKIVAQAITNPESIFQYYDLVKRLNLSALHPKVNDGTADAFVKCKRIERLTLTSCSALTDKGVSDLVEGNRQLQALDVSKLRSLTDHTLHVVAGNCPRLQGLNITGCQKITDESLIAVAGSCRHIKRLKLNGVTQVTDRSILTFAESCPSILEIDLHGCRFITNSAVTTLLCSLRNLRELGLSQCVDINDHAFLNLPQKAVFESLRNLDLTGCENVGDDAVEKIINSAPRLRQLVMGKCRFITDRSVQAICKLGKNIHHLHLGHCSSISDSAIIQLAKSCNRIRYIDLACCNRLTDASVEHLAMLPKLKRIGLVKCQSITDRSILALAKPRISEHPLPNLLERVHLSYCVTLTLQGIHQLLNHCPRLNHLSLTGVHAFLREDLTTFCREPPPEFTPQQREVFCVFSGDGVGRLRDFLNRLTTYPGDNDEMTMFDDGEELDDEEGQVTGLMNATGINDEDDDDDDITSGNTTAIQS